MKTLFPAQARALDFFVGCHKRKLATLDSSVVGTGKTIVAIHLALKLGQPIAVLCPKSVITNWKRELAAHGLEPLFVLNYEKIRNGKTEFLNKVGKKIMRWTLPLNTLVIVDECHKCKGPFTQNSQLLISAKQQNVSLHLLSATACEDPTEMRAIGFALGLHSLNNSVGVLRSWQTWMRNNGCVQDPWGGWVLSKRKQLTPIRNLMYNSCAFRLTVADFPDSFRNNRVQVLPVSCNKTTNSVYTNAGITEEAIVSYLEDETVLEDPTQEDLFIVRLLRARQEAELLKVPELVTMANDYVEQGMSVVLFVNFRETTAQLCEALKCSAIQGGQTADQRQLAVDQFQEDYSKCLVANIEAGGTGLSLHDTLGNRPRVALISPTFNVKSHLQVLGRIYRNGAKSDALQQIIVAADTVEEAVMGIITNKLKNLKALHGI